MNIYCEKHWSPLQCDVSAVLSPKYFERFVLPDIITQTEKLDYSIYYLNGLTAVPHLDILFKIPKLTGIEWDPGEGPPIHGEAYMDIYKKVQIAGKNQVFETHPVLTAHLYKVLEPKGLYVSTFFQANILADMCLPSFIDNRELIIEND